MSRFAGWLLEFATRQPDPIDECIFAAVALGLLWVVNVGLRLGAGWR